MQTVIEPLYKSKNEIIFGWKPEPGNVAVSYKMYVSLNSQSMTLLYSGISSQVSHQPVSMGKITYNAEIAAVRTALSLPATVDFANKVLYFAITYVNSANVESSIALSTIVEVPPVGIIPKFMKDDPTINRHIYFFSSDDQKWVKGMGTSSGALITSSSGFYSDNVVTDYTYDGTNVSTMRVYSSDATITGSPAKLTSYSYSGSLLTKVVTIDSTTI